MKKKILVTGGEGRFAKVLKSKNKKLNLIFVNKKYCNILDEYSLEKCIKKYNNERDIGKNKIRTQHL